MSFAGVVFESSQNWRNDKVLIEGLAWPELVQVPLEAPERLGCLSFLGQAVRADFWLSKLCDQCK